MRQLIREFIQETNDEKRYKFMAAGQAAMANGKNKADARDRQIAEFKKDIIERDKVIGELTIANRILKKRRTICINRTISAGTQRYG